MTKNSSKEVSKDPHTLAVWIILIWIFWVSTRLIPWLTAALSALLVAVLLAAAIDRIANAAARMIKLPKKLCSALIFFASAALLTICLFYLGELIIKEASELPVELSLFRADADALVIKLTSNVSGVLSAYLPFEVETEYLMKALSTASDSLIAYAANTVGKLAASAIGASPKIFFAAVTLLTACFYMTVDYDRISAALRSFLPNRFKNGISALRADIFKVVKSCVLAYLIFFIMTAVLVWIGLLILGSSYALIMALAVAFVDLLPVFGAGAVLLPWSAFAFAFGDPRFALGLLIIYGIVTVARKIAEPKILGDGLGIHPLLSLAFMTVGGMLFGFFGLILSPLAAYLFCDFIKKRAKSKKM